MTKKRSATLSDARQLSELAEQTFRDAFTEANNAEDMAMHCASTYGESIQTAELSDPNYDTIVVEDDGQLVAYAQLRQGHYPECVTAISPGEIQRLYVDKQWHGKGLAQALMTECLSRLREKNNDVVWLGVWEHNPRAIAFYKKLDFQPVGKHVFKLGNDPQTDIIMMRRIKAE
ncbi:GNAT family N-acetyltransferase [Pleionea mediterranea]|uniref:Ribosomal protein S18 acetylase RimI-like enzyme n=1 Tax=Pleionea mediterranea TaxID=523701 RepID=A0A316FAT6_9GAMM|nr:GNAT family N-acetyltransferase [Pleionea mediterranea]PWK45375.1 ribosomal protein S18 acetylase RimI-like enzyme [Pleionea mediterranea]